MCIEGGMVGGCGAAEDGYEEGDTRSGNRKSKAKTSRIVALKFLQEPGNLVLRRDRM